MRAKLDVFLSCTTNLHTIAANISGESLGYVVEEPRGFLSMFSRQLFRTHRPFRALVMDINGSPILWVRGFNGPLLSLTFGKIRRPFSWINSRMFVQRPQDSQTPESHDKQVLDTFAEVQQEWHLWRRKYNLFLKYVFCPASLLKFFHANNGLRGTFISIEVLLYVFSPPFPNQNQMIPLNLITISLHALMKDFGRGNS